MTNRTRRRPASWVVGAVAVALLTVILSAAGCSTDPPVTGNAPPPAVAEERTVFVALGGDETLNRGLADGFRTSWTRKVFGTLPHSAVYVNLASEDATVATGAKVQSERALALHPTIATVWFGAGDVSAHTSDAEFMSELSSIATRLKDGGARVLLLANTNDRSGTRIASMTEQVATQTGVVYVAVPGPSRNPGEVRVQDGIAEAVLARIIR